MLLLQSRRLLGEARSSYRSSSIDALRGAVIIKILGINLLFACSFKESAKLLIHAA